MYIQEILIDIHIYLSFLDRFPLTRQKKTIVHSFHGYSNSMTAIYKAYSPQSCSRATIRFSLKFHLQSMNRERLSIFHGTEAALVFPNFLLKCYIHTENYTNHKS